jgi:hypothetical protein
MTHQQEEMKWCAFFALEWSIHCLRVKMSELSNMVYDMASKPVELGVFLTEHPDVKVDLYKTHWGWAAMHTASRNNAKESVSLLLDHKADIDVLTSSGISPLIMTLSASGADDTALFLLERGADVHIKSSFGYDALYFALQSHQYEMLFSFVLMCYGADAKSVNVSTSSILTQATVDAAIAEYKDTHAFIERTHELLEHTLSNQVEADTRMGLRATGIYQEPLERTLEYLGLSMSPDQVVNISIDGPTPTRVLIPNQAANAKHWIEKHKARMVQQQVLGEEGYIILYCIVVQVISKMQVWN